LRQSLLSYSDNSGIADLTVQVDRDEASACGKIVRQPEIDLRKARIGYGSQVLSRHSECLTVSVD